MNCYNNFNFLLTSSGGATRRGTTGRTTSGGTTRRGTTGRTTSRTGFGSSVVRSRVHLIW